MTVSIVPWILFLMTPGSPDEQPPILDSLVRVMTEQIQVSGFFVRGTNADVFLVTSATIDPNAQGFRVIAKSEKENDVELAVTLVRRDTGLGLALYSLEQAAPKPLEIGTVDHIYETVPIEVLGFVDRPGKRTSPNRFEGAIASLRTTVGNRLLWMQLDAELEVGLEGAAVTDSHGKVVGILAGGTERSGIFFAIPADRLKNFVVGEPDNLTKLPESAWDQKQTAVKGVPGLALPDAMQAIVKKDLTEVKPLQSKKKVTLPYKTDGQTRLARGGRFLVARYAKRGTIAVVDLTLGKLLHTISVPSQRFLWTAGGDTLVYYLQAEDLIGVHRLSTGKRLQLRRSPLGLPISDIAMGRDHGRRLFIRTKGSIHRIDGYFLMDPEGLVPYPLLLENEGINLMEITLSRRKLFGVDPLLKQVVFYSHGNLFVIRLNGVLGEFAKGKSSYNYKTDFQPTSQGQIYGAHGVVFDKNVNPISSLQGRANLVPSQDGSFFVSLQKPSRGEAYFSAQLHHKDGTKIRSLPWKIYAGMWPGKPNKLFHRVFLVPEFGLAALLDEARAILELHPLKLEH